VCVIVSERISDASSDNRTHTNAVAGSQFHFPGGSTATGASRLPGQAQRSSKLTNVDSQENVDSQQTSKASLGGRRLGVPSVVAQALANTAPIDSALTFMPLVVGVGMGTGAGGAAPLSMLLAAIATFGIAWTLSRFSRHLENTGSSYVFISRSFGDRAGTAFGTLNYVAVVFGPLTPLIFGGYVSDDLRTQFGIDIPWWVISLGLVAAIGVAVSFGVEFSSRAMLALASVGMLTIISFSILVIVQVLGRGDVSATAPLLPSSSGSGWLGVFWGMLFGLSIFGGYDSAQNLSEETRDPKRSIPRAMLITVSLMAVYYVVVAYAQVVGFGMDSAAIADHTFPLLALAAPGSFGASWLVHLLTILLMLDDFSLCVAGAVYGSRGLFALARDGRLPAVFTIVSRKRNIPVVGMALQVAWMAVLVVVVHLTGRFLAHDGVPEYLPVFVWIGSAQGLITSIMSATICLGAFGWLRRRDKNPVLLIVAASIGVVAAGITLIASMLQASTGTYLALAAISVFLVISFVQSTILLRRGRFAPAAFLEDA